MAAWWISLGTVGQVFACIAIPASVILLIQTILMLFGIGSEDSGDSDMGHDLGHDMGQDMGHDFGHDMGHDIGHDFGHDGSGDMSDAPHDGIFGDNDSDSHTGEGMLGSGLRLFTFRGLIAFFSVLGWVGVICAGNGIDTALSVMISVAAGFLAMLVVALIMKWLLSLQYDGTENIRDALGVSGTVYMRVPPSRSGKGKVNCIIQGKLCEKYAVSDEETELKYGEEIVVIGITGEETLIVKRKK